MLILYLILQCRSQRRKRRAARAAGLHCDSNSGSFMERSTVDFIVPGEMELTSAVRSVSSSSKCNGLITKALSMPPPPSKDKDGCGSGNDGDDEEDYGLHSNKKSIYKNNSWGLTGAQPGLMQPPSYRHPPPYATGCPSSAQHHRNSMPTMCQCCGQFQQQWYPAFQGPPVLMAGPPPGPRMCPSRNATQIGKKHL